MFTLQTALGASCRRKAMIRGGTLLLGLTLAATLANAQTYPDKPIKLIAGPAPAGTVDKIARSLAKHLNTRLGQPVVVDNRPGAGGTISAEALATATPDGYTLSISSLPTTAITPVMEKVRYDPIAGTQPISRIGSQPYVLLVPLGFFSTRQVVVTKSNATA